MPRRRALRSILPALTVLVGLTGCTPYDPPFRGDHAASKYQSDFAGCRTSAQDTVRLKNAATPGRWIISPITGPPEVRADIRSCMAAKGYVLEAAPH